MASGLFINPKTLLVTAPLLTTSCTLLWAHSQHFFLSLLTTAPAPERRSTNAVLPAYFDRFFSRGLPLVLGFLAGTLASTSACVKVLGRAHPASNWFIATAALATGHLVYAPWVAPKIQTIVEGKKEEGEENVMVLEGWLSVNALRGLTTDLGGWVCCLVAVGKTLDVTA